MKRTLILVPILVFLILPAGYTQTAVAQPHIISPGNGESPENEGDVTQYALNATAEPTGSGSITLEPSGANYNAGTEVTLTASPESGYVFKNWSGDASGTSPTMTVIMDSDKSITAHFTDTGAESYVLTTSSNPSFGGSISLNPPGGTYSEGTEVTVSAELASGYEFDSWSGAVSSTSNPIKVTMDSDKSITAHFSFSGGVTEGGGGTDEGGLPLAWVALGIVIAAVLTVALLIISRKSEESEKQRYLTQSFSPKP